MFRIVGIEATQAIQVFRSTFPLCVTSTGQPGPCLDNSVRLVAGRRTVLRVYIEDAPAGTQIGAIATRGFPYTQGTESFVRFGTPIAAPPAQIVRTNAAHTVQIDLPAWQPGTWRFDVIAVAQLGSSYVNFATAPITLDFHQRRAVRIRLVRIHYRGRGMDVAAPSLEDFWTCAAFARRVLPLPHPGFEVVGDGVEDYDGDFTRIDPSAHDPMWPGRAANNGTTGNLLNIMDRTMAAESLPGDVIYLGLYPNGVRQSAFAGWAVGRWILTSLNGETVAHEVAHKAGVPQHAPCGGPANVDPSYPAYGSLPAGSIGEVGYDTVLNRTYDPNPTKDLMTYCGPKWISPYNYRKAFDALPPLPPPQEPVSLFTVKRKILIGLVRFPDRYVKVQIPPFPRPLLSDPWPPAPTVGEIRLLGSGGDLLGRAPAKLQVGIEPEQQGIPALVTSELPWEPDAVEFVLTDDEGEVLAREELVGALPELHVDWPVVDGVVNREAILRWDVPEPEGVWVAVRVTTDSGRTWTAVVRPASDGVLELGAFLGTAAGTRTLEVIATGGGAAVIEQSAPFRVRSRPEDVLILSPDPFSVHYYGEPIRFEATPEFGARESVRIDWYSDLDGHLATGSDCVVVGLSAGQHRIEARYPGGGGTVAAVEVHVRER
jgi:hypothetical protein